MEIRRTVKQMSVPSGMVPIDAGFTEIIDEERMKKVIRMNARLSASKDNADFKSPEAGWDTFLRTGKAETFYADYELLSQ